MVAECRTAVVAEVQGCSRCAGIRHPFGRTTEEDHYCNHCCSLERLHSRLDHHSRHSRHDHARPVHHHGMAVDRRSCFRIRHDREEDNFHVEGSFRGLGIPCPAKNDRNYLSIELKNLAILWDGKDY